MRTIKTWDGKIIVNAEKVLIASITNSVPPWIILELDTCHNSNEVRLAEYSTEERALRVLDELNEWLVKPRKSREELDALVKSAAYASKNGQYAGFKFSNPDPCFQMPRDGGELDA